MDSKERQITMGNNSHEVVFPTGLFGEKLFYDPFSEMEENIFSISPNGPLTALNFGSSYSSPVGSEIGSTETESEDGVSLAELTRRVAEYTFQDDDENGDVPYTKPEYSEYNYPGGAYDYFSKGSIGKPDNPVLQSEIYCVQPQIERKGRKLKVVEQKEQNKGKERKSYGTGNAKSGKFAQVLAAQGGSGMRAVFLGGSNNGKSGSGGTGVFLPAANYQKEEPKRKPGCSTVLIPARVLHTLQQHFTNVGAQSESHNTSDVLDRINGLLSQQKEQAQLQTNVPLAAAAAAATNHDLEELRLPNEWTY